MDKADKVEVLRKLLHPNWVAALQAAVRTEGREGWSQVFDCLRVCPGCGLALTVRRRGTFWQDMDGVVDRGEVLEEELGCDECYPSQGAPSPLQRALEGCQEAVGDATLDLWVLNAYLVAEWLHPHWQPTPELTDACLMGNPLAQLFYTLAGEALDDAA